MLLLTRTSAYAYLEKVIVAEITSTIRAISQEVRLGRNEGLRRQSVANFDNIHVVPKSSLSVQIGSLAAEREHEVKRALGFALDWPELKIL